MSRVASDWISLTEAVEILEASNIHLRVETLGRWAREGKLQTLKLGGRRYVRRVEVRALLRPRRRVAAEELQPGLFEEL
jgi:predicted site-specific integrase-resolvase